ncbi:MAG TPA: hypothetical protein VFK68_13125 [Propionibacteriaceae bacterium]|nr:hypothetical protein [Propionibacteriaceae bacterium]
MSESVRTPTRVDRATPGTAHPRRARHLVPGVAIVLTALAALAALGVGWSVWSASAVTARDLNSKAATAARNKAKPAADADVERLVRVLAPTLGTPVDRAMADGCMLNDLDSYVSAQVKCKRQYELYYRTEGDPPKAPAIAQLLAADAQSTVTFAHDTPGWSSNATLQYRTGLVEVVARPSDAKDGAYTCLGLPWTIVEEQGCADMQTRTGTGTYVLVAYSRSYSFG